MEGGIVEVFFHIDSFANRLRLPIRFYFASFLDYSRITLSQLYPNNWRILTAFFNCMQKKEYYPTTNLFQLYYRLKCVHGFYFFKAHGLPSVVHLVNKIKDWKKRFYCVRSVVGFGFNVN